MELLITDTELELIITRLDDSPFKDRLELITQVRKENPGGPWKKILREQHNMVI
jgi:hypothetical protein